MTLENLSSTYKRKKVFLTGHTGFKGTWLLYILSLLDAEVMGYALEPENSFDLYHTINGNKLNKSIIGDLRDREKLQNAIESFQPDFIFHLAAQPLVRLSYEIPSETFEVNAIGTANVLDSVRTLDKKCQIILITTDKVYHNNEWVYPYRESDRLGGYDPYSASKACAELVIDSYRNSFFNISNYSTHNKSIAVGRAGNVIGGGDWAKDRLIPDIVRALTKEESVIIRNPDAVRPWQHVLEPLSGYLMLGQKLAQDPIKYSSAYNFGPYISDAINVQTMVELAIKSWGRGNYSCKKDTDQPHEAGLLKLDITKACIELNWEPKMNAEMAIKATIDWYRSFHNQPEEIADFTKAQVNEFFK